MFHWEVLFISLQGAGKFFVEVEYSNEFFFRIILIISELLYTITNRKILSRTQKKSLEKWTNTPYAIRYNSFITCCGDDDKKSLKRANLKKKNVLKDEYYVKNMVKNSSTLTLIQLNHPTESQPKSAVKFSF